MSWLRSRFIWKGMKQDVTRRVRNCLQCSLGRLSAPGKQARMMTWHPLRRFQIVAIDILEVSTSDGKANGKVAVIGDLFSRFVWACPIRNEKTEEIARVILDEWVLRFGPPERLMSDRGKTFVSGVIRSMCEYIGTRKVFTSPYNPQTDGFIERFNRTLCRDIKAFVAFDEHDWKKHISMACFRYNTSVNAATGIKPYKAVFGIEEFDFDAEVGRCMKIDEEEQSDEDLAKRLHDIHPKLLSSRVDSRMQAAKQYNKLVDETQYEVGERFFVLKPRHHLEKGRK